MSKFKQLIESCIGPEQAKEALATSIVESDCEGKEEMKKSERSSNPYHKGHANTAFTRLENAKEAGISGFRDTVEGQLNEQIKGWKHAHSDLAKERKDASNYKKSAVLHALKKDGSESKMHDARKHFSSEQEARAHHERVVKLNPNRSIKHALYIDGKHVENLGESEVKTFRELVEGIKEAQLDELSKSTDRLVKESEAIHEEEKDDNHYKQYGEDAHGSHLMGKRAEGKAADAKTDHERYKHFAEAAGHYGDRDHAVATHLRSSGEHEAASQHYDTAFRWKHRQVQHMRRAVEEHAHHVHKAMNDLVY